MKKPIFPKTIASDPQLPKEETLIEKVPLKSDKTSDTQQPATDGQLATEQTVYYFL
jgi:hypothetical protein